MKTFTIALAAALVAAMAAPVRAEFYSGSKLLQLLEAGDRVDRGVGSRTDFTDGALAMGFVAGVYDVYVDASFCPPANGITLGQANAIAIMYLRALPHRHHEVAYALVKEAFDRAFPCQQRPRPQGRQL